MYVSGDTGQTNNYLSTGSSSWAYIDVTIPTGYTEFVFGFDWKCYGASNYDFMKVFVGAPSTPSGDIAPAGTVFLVNDLRSTNQSLFNGYDGSSYSLSSTWQHCTTYLQGSLYGGQTIRLYFYWENAGWFINSPAMALDNISLTGNMCGTVNNLAAVPSATSLSVSFVPALDSDNAWDYICVPYGHSIENGAPVPISSTTFTINNLTSDTKYDVYVRNSCSNDNSAWKKITVRTTCSPYMILPYTDNFDSYGDEDYPNCWFRFSNDGSGELPVLLDNYAYSGTTSMYMESVYYGDSYHYYSIAILPEVDTVSDPINTLSVSFKMFKDEASLGHCDIGVMSDPTADSTFTLVASILPSDFTEATVWREFNVDLSNYTGTGTYIAFRNPEGSNDVYYLDDITVYVTTSCAKPLNVVATTISYNQVTLEWSPQGSATEWDVAVVPAGTDLSTITPETVSSHPATIHGLAPNTYYEVYVRSNCGNDEVSSWSSFFSITTYCPPTTILPYTENFDNCATGASAALPDCWQRRTDYTILYPYPVNSYFSSDYRSMQFHSAATNYSALISQALDLSSYDAGSLHLTCKTMIATLLNGRLDIGYTTDPNDLSTFTLLKSVYPSDYDAIETWYLRDVVLTEHFTEPIYLTFMAPNGDYNTVYLDDVVLDTLSGCPDPANLNVFDIAVTSARVSWTASTYGAVDYTVDYSVAGVDTLTSVTVTGTQALLAGLSPATTYNVRVSSNCGSTISNYLTTTFTTRSFPVTCSAEDTVTIGNGTTTSSYLPMKANYSYSYSQQIFTATEINLPTGGQLTGIAFEYDYTSSNDNKTNVTIYLKHTTDTAFASTTAWIPFTSAVPVYSGSLVCTQGWNYFTFDQPFSYNGTDNLVLIVDDNSGNSNSYYCVFKTHAATQKAICYGSDYTNPNPATPPTSAYSNSVYDFRNNVKFINCTSSTPILCANPNAYISSIDDNSITLTWARGNDETSWEIDYKLASDSEWTVSSNITSSPYTLNGLVSGSNYDVRIRSNCTPDYSEWVSFNVTTECTAASLPITENFDSASGDGEGNFISCWTKGTNSSTEYPYTSSDYAYSSPYSLYFTSDSYYSYAAAPRLESSVDMSDLQISFQMRKGDSNDPAIIEVGIMTDPNDITTFVSLGSRIATALSNWEFTEINTTNYVGSGRYVAFRAPQGTPSYIYIDNVTIQNIPSCVRVNDITATTILAHSATINWTAGGDESAWEYIYGEHGTVDLENDVPIQTLSTSASLTGLTDNTTYDIYIRGNCDNGEYSTWMSFIFRTVCNEVVSLPYSESFDTYGNVTYPYCWFKINTEPYAEGLPSIELDGGFDPHSAPGMLAFGAYSYGAYNIAITPPFAASIPVNTLQVSFQFYAEGPSDQLIVGVMTNPADASTFVPVETVTNTSAETWCLKRVILSNYTGTGQYIAIKNECSLDYSSTYIDDVSIDLAPSCYDPSGFVVSNLSGTSADLVWQNAVGENTCQILVVANDSTPDFDNPIVVTTSQYSCTGLTPNTMYHAYLRTVCSDNTGYSNWIDISFMTTGSNLAQTPYFHDFDDATENAQWTLVNGSCINKWYIGQPIGFTDSVLYISNDNGTNNSYAISSTSTVWAYRDIHFGAGSEFNLSIQWRNVGENNYDYIKFFIGSPMPVTAGSSISVPAGAISLNNSGLSSQSSWQTFSYVFNGSYANTTQRLYILWRNDNGVGVLPPGAIDTIQITVNNCGRPYQLVSSNISSSSANINFTPASTTDAAWQYIVGLYGFNPNGATPVDISANSFQLTNLTPNAHYQVYVRTACASDSYSDWSEAVDFTTPCVEFADYPYIEDFEHNGNMPDCWTQEYFDSYPAEWTASSGSDYGTIDAPHLGAYNALFITSDGDMYRTRLISPIFDLTQITDPYLSFWHAQEEYSEPYWGTYQDTLGVYYRTSTAAEWTYLTSFNSSISTWTFDSLALPNPSATYQIAFDGMVQGGNGITLDDITINGTATACDAPTGLTSAVTAMTATLAWTETGNFEVAYKPTSATDWSANTSVTGSTTTLTGLTANTAYDWRVRKVCDASTNSDWATGSFTTSEESSCPMPTNLAASDITGSSVTLSWDQETGTATEWTLNYRKVNDSQWTTSTITTNPYTIMDLVDHTDYEVQIRSNCSDGTFSEYTDIVTFPTTNINDYTLSNSISLYPNPTTSYIDVKFTDNIQVSVLKVYDVYGKLLQTITVNENPTRINVSGLSDGVYFVRAVTENGIANKSFIKR